MALSVRSIYNSILGSFNAVSGDRFDKDFPVALNTILDELSFCGGLSTPISHPTTLDSNISELDEDDSNIVLTGLVPFLMQSGQVSVSGADFYPTALGMWTEAKGQWQVKKSIATQASNLDDDGNTQTDIIGLGYRG